MSARTAIVTLALGDEYRRRWDSACRPGWEAYAARHGYDLIVLTEALDGCERARARSPSWQKLLICGRPFAERYDRLVWLDADMVVNPAAPAVTAGVGPDRVGAVDEFGSPSPDEHRRRLRRAVALEDDDGVRAETADDYYRLAGLEPAFEHVVQGGLLVVSPEHHRELLEHVYHEHEDVYRDYEMSALSWELQRAGVVQWLDPRFNLLWPHHKALHAGFLQVYPRHPRAMKVKERALRDSFFLHFAGSFDELPAEPLMPAAPAARRRSPLPDRPTAPVVITVYRRPQTTRRVMEAVRAARPQRLLMVADAPRPGEPGEAELCERAQAAVLDAVDWDCELSVDIATEHLTLKRRIESGLDWAFEQVEEAIVLEDDCLPSPELFAFCTELLERHRHDERVMSISGDNFEFGTGTHEHSYYFSRYQLIWGWATWRRAWERHDPAMRAWPGLRDAGWLEELFEGDAQAVAYWRHHLDRCACGQIDSWDYAWNFTCWAAGGLCAQPASNLVSNIGFGSAATHTKAGNGSLFADLPRDPLGFPLSHPSRVERDIDADAFTELMHFSGNLGLMFERVRAARAAGAR